MTVTPEIAPRSISSRNLENIVTKYFQQKSEGGQALNPACYVLDDCTTTDWAIPGIEKHYGKMDTYNMGFTLPNPKKIYLLIVPPETAEPWTNQKKITLEPILEKDGGGPNLKMEVDVTFPDQLTKAKLDKLIPLANVYGGGFNVLNLQQTGSGGSRAVIQTSGKAFQLRNLERVLKVMGKSTEYAVTKK